jgi:hypothetical protein
LRERTVYDADLEDAVNRSLRDMGNARASGVGRLCIQLEHAGAVRGVARGMVREQYAMEVWRELDDGDVRRWVGRMGEAVEWRLRRDE